MSSSDESAENDSPGGPGDSSDTLSNLGDDSKVQKAVVEPDAELLVSYGDEGLVDAPTASASEVTLLGEDNNSSHLELHPAVFVNNHTNAC